MKKNCVVCGSEFEAKGKGSFKKITCSQECKRLRRNEWQREWRRSPKGSAYVKKHRKEYAEQSKLNQRKKMRENREEHNRKHREYMRHKRATDPEFDKRMRENSRLYMEKRLKNDSAFRLSQRLSCILRESLKAKKITKRNRTRVLVGYTPEELKKHMESKFQEGMSWDNMGDWHIDHIRPVASFNYTTTDCEDFKKCWALENLQPMWATDNMSKGSLWKGKRWRVKT